MDAKITPIDLSRRDFLAGLVATGLAGGIDGRFLDVLAAQERLALEQVRIIFQSSFERGQPIHNSPDHQIVSDKAHTGKCSLMGQVSESRKACILEIPFTSQKGKIIHVSFWVRSDNKSACSVFVRIDKKKISLGRRMDNIPVRQWKQVQTSYKVEQNTRGTIQIVAPSSFNAPVGKAWIDDVIVYETTDECNWPGHVQDFSALACDKSENLWMATLERPMPRRFIRVYRLEDLERKEFITLEPENLTGIAAPAIVGLNTGCFVAFPVEQRGKWRIAYSFIDNIKTPGTACRYIDCEGTANISPALAVAGGRIYVVWESNAGMARGIYACRVEPDKAGRIQRISSEDANSYNPAIVALEDGSLFAAWDSVRDKKANIYGAWFRNGQWQKERRITSDVRIERHPSLAVRNNEIWMAWQAQSYKDLKINNLDEQLVVVARLEKKLHAPCGLFEKISTSRKLLLRPRIAFDSAGRLWLTARQSMGPQDGWQPLAWCYTGGQWSRPWVLTDQRGRWRAVNMAVNSAGILTASQYDDLPNGWKQQGIHPDWQSGLLLKSLPKKQDSTIPELKTEPLKMPPTEFSLKQKSELCGADLPRQRWPHEGQELTLFWGDFHDHTDISVCVRDKNPPGHDLYANERDIEKLDFCTLTDHGYNFDPPQWAYNGEQTRNNHDPGRFVTFLGEEWTSSRNPPAEGGKMNRYGHHNLVFLDPYHKKFYDSFDSDISPADLWKELEGHEYICIPHQLADWKGKGKGNPPTDWSFVDERLQPVAEIFQTRQSYEYLGCPRQAPQGAPFKGHYLQDAWAKGVVIGVIASPDHGGGNGKAGVWARELTRESIFEAVRARHTFGTSGAKMALRFSAGRAIMGDKVKHPEGAIDFRITALAMRNISELVIFRNNEIVYRTEPGRKEFDTEWTDKKPPKENALWYYARIQAEDNELAWSSPIWFM